VSHRAEAEFEAWRGALGEGEVQTARVDVIEERPLARGLTSELGVAHQSPQALVFRGGELHAHASHGELVRGWFRDQVSGT